MATYKNLTLDEERALYGIADSEVTECRFDGPADGESAFKECKNITVSDCFFNLRYPFWHDDRLVINSCEMTENCRAALWYSSDIVVNTSKLHGIKAMRECKRVAMNGCSVISPEFGWSTEDIILNNCDVTGEYFMLRGKNIAFNNVTMKGKYSFQYIEDSVFENCSFDTKDAFWHAKNVTVRNSTVKGEYLAWYCENVTFENCKIIGTQPLCYCKGLKLINCTMEGCDLSFEKSEVEATVIGHIDSVKNPKVGYVKCASVGEIIFDDPAAEGKVIVNNTEEVTV